MSDALVQNDVMDSTSVELRIVATPVEKNGSASVSCVWNGKTIHRDEIKLAKAADRKRFATAVLAVIGDQSAITLDSIQRELIATADRLETNASERSGQDQASQAVGATEVPVNQVTRPELIIQEKVSAIAIPRLAQIKNEVVGDWMHYVRNGSDRRTVILTERLDVPGTEGLWLSPLPSTPTPGDVRDLNRWSIESRTKWLEGTPSPSTGEVLRLVAERIDRYIVLPGEAAPAHGLTLAAWVMMTYVYPALPALPYLYLSGPPNSGKTRTMDVLSRMVFRPMMTGNISAPTIFRTRHTFGGVLLLDEAERMQDSRSPDVQELLSILLCG